MPHINILYPFINDIYFESQIEILNKLLKKIKPFEIELNKFDYFPNRNNNMWYLYLTDSSLTFDKNIRNLFNKLNEIYPQYKYNGHPKPSNFHLTVGQFDKNEINTWKQKFQHNWKPIKFTCDNIRIISSTNI